MFYMLRAWLSGFKCDGSYIYRIDSLPDLGRCL